MVGRQASSSAALPLEASEESIRGGLHLLTPREKQILEGILHAESAKRTAIRLNISHRTVETHRGRIFEKLRARGVLDILRVLRPGDTGVEFFTARPANANRRLDIDRMDLDADGFGDNDDSRSGLVNIFSDVRYTSHVDPTAVTVMMAWDADHDASGFVILPSGGALSAMHNPAFDGLLPLESALAYGLFLSLKTEIAMRISGDLSVWKDRWGCVPGHPERVS